MCETSTLYHFKALIGLTLRFKLNFIAYAADKVKFVTYAASGDITTYAVERMFIMSDLSILEELNKALRIRKPKVSGDTTTNGTTKVRDIKYLFETDSLFVDFYYEDADIGKVREAEVVIEVNELESDILNQPVRSAYIFSDDSIGLRVDIIRYINAVLNNPIVPEIRKNMLATFKQQVLRGEIF